MRDAGSIVREVPFGTLSVSSIGGNMHLRAAAFCLSPLILVCYLPNLAGPRIRSGPQIAISSQACEDLAASLNSEVESRLERDHLTLSAGAKASIASFIDSGATKLRNASEKQCQEAKANFSTFVTQLINNAETDPRAIGKSTVTVKSFERAKSSVCPLYPFC
jgi:hypothetical protein